MRDIELHLPDSTISGLKGKVRREIRSAIRTRKNQIAVELLGRDMSYTRLISACFQEESERI